MAKSFFDKLKKGMDTEELIEEPEESTEEITEEPTKEIKEEPVEELVEEPPKKTKKKVKKEKKPTPKPEEKTIQKKVEIKTVSLEEKTEESPKEKEDKKTSLLSEDDGGQLAIDVYQTEDEIVIQSAIAGVKPENLDISFEKEIITIKGRRDRPFKEKGDYFFQECYWGSFSREIILPLEVDAGRAEAEMKEGVLTIRIPKILREKIKKIIVKG